MEHHELDTLLEQLAGRDVPPPEHIIRSVRSRIRRRQHVLKWTVVLSLVLNAILFLGLLAAPLLPGLTTVGRFLIIAVESMAGSIVILLLLSAREQVGKAVGRLEVLLQTH